MNSDHRYDKKKRGRCRKYRKKEEEKCCCNEKYDCQHEDCPNCMHYPCNCQEQTQKVSQSPIQEGPEQTVDQEQDSTQTPTQEGPEQTVGQEQDNNQTPTQVGPEQNQGQEQNNNQTPTQIGPDQDQGQAQTSTQTPTQEGPVIDQEQNTTQNPVITGPSPEQTVTQTSNPQTDTITTPINITTPTTTQTSTTTPTQTSTQNPTQTQEGLTQTQDEEQTQTLGDQLQLQRHGDQTQGSQNIGGHTNTSPLNNTQTISTPTTVSGVTVTVPVTLTCGCNCNKKDECKCDNKKDRECRKDDDCNKNCKKGCDCCTSSVADLLRRVQNVQSTILPPEDKAINIYANTTAVTPNPVLNQVITNVNDCSTVTFKNADQLTNTPNTTFRLDKIAGISAINNPVSTTDIFDFLLAFANTCDNIPPEDRNKDCLCGCRNNPNKSCCCDTLESELRAAATFGLSINLLLEGVAALPTSVFVLKICDCIGFFVDNLTAPTVIYAFSLCAIDGITVPSQMLL
ncbi:hypothetical protein ICR95_28805 (plasmid) [Priestia megaterium]|uniref:hypothetical protein n=1 Tax=Priestia megaterium TaxID=1404 RepID=UPI00196BA17C|nr:hypothetical protein [Priestia megaterium]QSF36522.1 hypothetical protein ICR95_28805 [Priestia megaterium]